MIPCPVGGGNWIFIFAEKGKSWKKGIVKRLGGRGLTNGEKKLNIA